MPSAKQELEGLWRAVFGEPPSIEADPAILTAVLVRHLPLAPPYAAGADAEAQPAPSDDVEEVEPKPPPV